MRSTRVIVLASVVTPMALAFAGCTLGIGDYAVGSELGAEQAAAEGGSADGAGAETDGRGSSADPDAAPAVGPCTESTQPRACSIPDGDAGDAGICNGTQKCILGAWGACAVSKTCPATWTESTATQCQKTDLKPDSVGWAESPAQGSDVTLADYERAASFDLYQQNDQFCFTPKQSGDCFVTSGTALEVICTNTQKKLSAVNFDDGNVHNRRICLDYTGPHCTVTDKSHLVWTDGAVPCTRSFVDAAFTVAAPPRCSSW